MAWTQAQQDAIDARNDTLLVSAAAGSGKTAVLVERVYRLLQAGGRIDRMLIVTFTRAAAGEMRERIEKRLSQETDAHLRRQAARVPRAMSAPLRLVRPMPSSIPAAMPMTFFAAAPTSLPIRSRP